MLANSGLNFIGNIEPKEFTRGVADVAVTDGFTGNIIMKTVEAVASYMRDLIRTEIRSSRVTTLGGLLAKPAFTRISTRMDPDGIGGAPLLGVNGVVVIGHGRSNAYAIQQAIIQAHTIVEKQVLTAIQEGLHDKSIYR